MEQTLHRLHHDRPFAADNCKDTLDPQEIVAVRHDQRIEPVGHVLPMQRLREFQAERTDVGAVAVDVVMVLVRMR